MANQATLDHLKQACALISVDDNTHGTGYFVGQDIVITCEHVVRTVSNDRTVKVQFRGGTFWATVIGVRKSDDCAVLRVNSTVQDIKPLELGSNCAGGESWQTYGFPRSTDLKGLPLRGTVEDPNGTDAQDKSALILSVDGGVQARLQGFSGSPVLVDGVVVGHFRNIIPDDEGGAQMGVVYACPIDSIKTLIPIKIPSKIPPIVEAATPQVATDKPPGNHFEAFLLYLRNHAAHALAFGALLLSIITLVIFLRSQNDTRVLTAQPKQIILASDFGQDDFFVSAMQGQIRVMAPEIHGVHYLNLPKFNDFAAGMKLVYMSQFFPKDAVFAVQYNPSGASQEPIAFRTKRGVYFVGFTNRVADIFAIENGGVEAAYIITNKDVILINELMNQSGISVVAPAAAHLALHQKIDSLGNKVDYRPTFAGPPKRGSDQALDTAILSIDSFGNCLTSARLKDLGTAGPGDVLIVEASPNTIQVPLMNKYIDVDKGQPVAINVGGFIQLAVRNGSFMQQYGLDQNSRLFIRANR